MPALNINLLALAVRVSQSFFPSWEMAHHQQSLIFSIALLLAHLASISGEVNKPIEQSFERNKAVRVQTKIGLNSQNGCPAQQSQQRQDWFMRKYCATWYNRYGKSEDVSLYYIMGNATTQQKEKNPLELVGIDRSLVKYGGNWLFRRKHTSRNQHLDKE